MINRKIAISDIHGCCKTFNALLKLLQYGIDDELYLLGDYIDRGPDSKGVIDYIWALKKEGHLVHCLKGNHEQMMLNASFEGNTSDHWTRNGGQATLASFGADNVQDIPEEYLIWIRKLPFYFLTNQYILVHAGLNFKEKSPLSELKDMLWIRDWYDDIDKEWLQGATIIHGHTIMRKAKIEEMLRDIKNKSVLDIDNGCIFKESTDKGRLCAFDMTNQQLYFQENID